MATQSNAWTQFVKEPVKDVASMGRELNQSSVSDSNWGEDEKRSYDIESFPRPSGDSSISANEELRPWTRVEQQWDELREPSQARRTATIAAGVVITGCYVVAAGIWVFR